ncbi:MAG TPA: acireductone synthase [Phycisphaerae bacterium]|nr:acireductone synthase [Phycisphaerae bacterium]
MIRATASIVLLDIEGTVAPISYVYGVLFPHVRTHLRSFLSEHWNDPQVQTARKQIATDAADPSLADDQNRIIIETLRLMDADSKTTGLKMLQGQIWDVSYRAGTLRSELFPDVLPALRHWKQAGKTLAIYSSGSVAAQQVFFKYTSEGDATPLLSHFFDTTSGPKRSAQSYRTIAAALHTSPESVLFLTDVLEEAAAAREAGMLTAILLRPGNAPLKKPADFPTATTLAGISLD